MTVLHTLPFTLWLLHNGVSHLKKRAFIKLNYNKMQLVGFICNNCITVRGIDIVKITPNVIFVCSHSRWHIYMNIQLWRFGRLLVSETRGLIIGFLPIGVCISLTLSPPPLREYIFITEGCFIYWKSVCTMYNGPNPLAFYIKIATNKLQTRP
jgi:hypothetical protein